MDCGKRTRHAGHSHKGKQSPIEESTEAGVDRGGHGEQQEDGDETSEQKLFPNAAASDFI